MEPAGTNNARGIVLMIVAMAGFAIADTLIKSAAGRISPAQVMFLLMGGGLLVFASIALLKGQRLLDARAFAPMMVLRYLSEIISVGGMVLALSFVPLSTVGGDLAGNTIAGCCGGRAVSWRKSQLAALERHYPGIFWCPVDHRPGWRGIRCSDLVGRGFDGVPVDP